MQGEVVTESEKNPEGWTTADKFRVMHETPWFNAKELSAYCREHSLFPEQIDS